MKLEFYRGKRVLITGHTGFKGTWLCKVLSMAGAEVTGYAMSPIALPNLFELSGMENRIKSTIGDVRNLKQLENMFSEVAPEIVFHLAAQPIVRDSYKDPVYTYETNVMGTVNVLECIRNTSTVKSFLNITTDKVYRNNEWMWGYRENEVLDGYDPYSNSKSCSELVTHGYKNSFFNEGRVAISTARAGNVIGGGDFSKDRIVPDCVRAVEAGRKIVVRNPYSIRPYQHVLDPIFAYLLIAQKQYEEIKYADSYNVGPDEADCVTTGELVQKFCDLWGRDVSWEYISDKNAVHEANFLKLDCSKMKTTFDWRPRWHIDEALEKTIEWTRTYLEKANVEQVMEKQINDFMRGQKNV